MQPSVETTGAVTLPRTFAMRDEAARLLHGRLAAGDVFRVEAFVAMAARLVKHRILTGHVTELPKVAGR